MGHLGSFFLMSLATAGQEIESEVGKPDPPPHTHTSSTRDLERQREKDRETNTEKNYMNQEGTEV